MNTIIEIILLTIFFTIGALWFDIHGKGNVYESIAIHLMALLIAILLSKLIYVWIYKN